MKKKTSKKKIVVLILILAAVALAAVLTVSFLSKRNFTPASGGSTLYAVPPMPSDKREAVVANELARLASFEDAVPADASEKHKYDIKIAADGFTDDYAYAMIALHETVSFKNTTGQALKEISLRDYAQAWIEEARAYIPVEGDTPFDTDTEIFNVKNAKNGAVLSAARDELDPSVIYVSLDKELADGEQAAISFDFTVPVTQTGLRGCIAEIGRDKYAMELGNIYPVLSEWKNGGWINNPDLPAGECFLSTCSDYEVTVSAPEGWSVIATGSEEETETADGYTVWHCSAANVRDFVLTVSNGHDYAETITATGVKTRFWYYKDGNLPGNPYYGDAKTAFDFEYTMPENYKEVTDAALSAAVLALELYDEKIGAYPYDSMDVVVSSLGRDSYFGAGGMEYPQYVTVSDIYMNDILSTNSFSTDELYRIIAHEIGHNWFYGVAGNDEYNDTWLDEGLTTVLENLFEEEAGKNDDPAANGKDRTAEEAKKFKMQVDLPAGEYSDEQYSPVLYSRAAYFMFEVRDAIGEKAFLDMLAEYYETYSFREATTEQFIAIAEKYIDGNSAAQKLFKQYLSKY